MLLTFKWLFYSGTSLVMLIYHTVSYEVRGSFSNLSSSLCSWFLYQFLWFFFFCFVSGGKQKCLFILCNNFLQPNADLPYKQILRRFPVFQDSGSCKLCDARQWKISFCQVISSCRAYYNMLRLYSDSSLILDVLQN